MNAAPAPALSGPVRGARARTPRKAAGSRELILNAAERLFANHGYRGASIRMICDKCGINQGLVHYHFGSKQNLFTEVFLRRGRFIAEERARLLDEAETAAGGRPLTIEALVRCFVVPPLRLFQQGAAGRAFVRIQARLQSEPRKLAMELRSRVYDDTTFRFVAAIRRVLPQLPARDVYWRFNFMIGAYLSVIAQNGRLEIISRGTCSSLDVAEAEQQMVAFLVAGFRGATP